MQQVLLNLLSNAIKFTDRDGEITIIVEYLSFVRKSFAFSGDEPQMLKFSVKDTGIGIKKKYHKKLFNMFVSFKDSQKKINTSGIGLGLVISKLIVNKFNG